MMTPDLKACLEGRYDESEAMIRRFANPDSPLTKFALGFHDLRAGRLQKGFEGLDCGRFIDVWGRGPLAAGTPIPHPSTDLRGKTVVLRLEGGAGDEMVGARFAEHLKERGAKVILGCRYSLMPLLSRSPGVDAVVAHQGAKWTLHDYWIPAMSAPRVLGLDWGDLWRAPYLTPSSAAREKWSALVDDCGPRLRVGIRWRGLPDFEHEQYRRFDPGVLFGLGSTPGVCAFSLQRDEGSEMLPADCGVRDLGGQLETWDDTAAAISQLDLVISSCTSVAHLAASMGKPTWIITPATPYYLWAWPMDSNKSPWYGDHVALFRQQQFGEWGETLDRVIEAVKQKVSYRSAKPMSTSRR